MALIYRIVELNGQVKQHSVTMPLSFTVPLCHGSTVYAVPRHHCFTVALSHHVVLPLLLLVF